jgi:hypothetical protein
MTRPDYVALGFTVTAAQARAILGLDSLAEVYDHIRSGVLVSLYAFRDGRPTPMFHPDELADLEVRKREGRLVHAQRTSIRAQGVLREYLASHEPMIDYDEAVDSGYPVIAGAESGSAVYVQSAPIVAWFNAHRDLAETGTVTVTSLDEMLTAIGAIRRRGFVAWADRGTGRQRWARWWRLPRSFLEMTAPDPARLLPGDRIVRDADGSRLSASPLGS